jgi:hypothetical protein
VIRASLSFLAASVLIFSSIVPGCAAQRRARYDAAVAADRAPADFWLSVTVLKAPADTASRAAAYQRIPLARRPARYIVEADRVLRAAVGSGASDETFPPETRQLSEEEFQSLWSLLRNSSLVQNDHPALVGRAPAATSIGAATIYVVSFSIDGERRTLALEAEPNPAPSAPDAAALVERLGGFAWLK